MNRSKTSKMSSSSKRLNIPLPPMRPRGERHLSPFYRPAPHSNPFTDPDKDYDKLRSEARQNRGEDSDPKLVRLAGMRAWVKRQYRKHKRLGSNHEEAHEKVLDDFLTSEYTLHGREANATVS